MQSDYNGLRRHVITKEEANVIEVKWNKKRIECFYKLISVRSALVRERGKYCLHGRELLAACSREEEEEDTQRRNFLRKHHLRKRFRYFAGDFLRCQHLRKRSREEYRFQRSFSPCGYAIRRRLDCSRRIRNSLLKKCKKMCTCIISHV